MYLNHVQNDKAEEEIKEPPQIKAQISPGDCSKNPKACDCNNQNNNSTGLRNKIDEKVIKITPWWSDGNKNKTNDWWAPSIGDNPHTAFKRNISPANNLQKQLKPEKVHILDSNKLLAPQSIKPFGSSIYDRQFSNDMNLSFSKSDWNEFSDTNKINVFTENQLECPTKPNVNSEGLRSLPPFSSIEESQTSNVPKTMNTGMKPKKRKQIKIGYEEEKDIKDINVSRDVFIEPKPQWENMNSNTPANREKAFANEDLLNLPCIKSKMGYTTVDPRANMKHYTNDFDLMMEANTSTAQCRHLWGNGSICPELLPVMCDNYKNSRWNCTNIWKKKMVLLGLQSQ